jgi:aminopeptidase N
VLRRPSAAAVVLAASLAVSSIAAADDSVAERPPGTAATPGSPGSGDSLFPRQGNGGYDVRHYTIGIHWRPNGTITATTAVTAVATQALSRFNLDFRGLTVDAVTVAGDPADWQGPSHNELAITPPTALADGQVFRTVVRYHGKPHFLSDPDGSPDGWLPTADGATALSEPIGAMTWFPDNNTPSDKATFDITVTAPSAKKVASNGRLLGRTANGNGTTTWRWRESDPMATYLTTVSIGDYKMVTGTGHGRVKGVGLRSFLDTSMGGVQTASQVGDVVGFLAGKFGPYPFGSAGIIVDNVPVGYSLEVQTRPVFPYDPGVGTLLAHELAHQWFGDSVSLTDWSDIWLNEGFATYAEWLWAGRANPGAPARRFHSLYHDNGPQSPFWNGVVARPASAAALFDTSIVYDRGAMALEAVRERIGTADFFRLVHRWTSTLQGGNATTARFETMAETVSGEDLGALFDNWLHRSGRPPAP